MLQFKDERVEGQLRISVQNELVETGLLAIIQVSVRFWQIGHRTYALILSYVQAHVFKLSPHRTSKY